MASMMMESRVAARQGGATDAPRRIRQIIQTLRPASVATLLVFAFFTRSVGASNHSNGSNSSNVDTGAPENCHAGVCPEEDNYVLKPGAADTLCEGRCSVADRTLCCDEVIWPPCPEKGCLPCPLHASGRPDCRCVHGYVAMGSNGTIPMVPRDGINQTELVAPQLPWDSVKGWLAQCVPIKCAIPEQLPHASLIGDDHDDRESIIFGGVAFYLCEEGYTSQGYQEPPQGSPSNYDTSRLIDVRCVANAAGSPEANTTGRLCVPICGDGRLVPIDHMPLYYEREQCDDGNLINGDGCSSECRVEVNYVCTGGDRSNPDVCRVAGVFARSSVVLTISGRRSPPVKELKEATIVALARALSCPSRDIQDATVQSSADPSSLPEDVQKNLDGISNSPQESAGDYHSHFLTAKIDFRVKISDPGQLSIDEVRGSLQTPAVFLPKLTVAYKDMTSLTDLYVRAIEVAPPEIDGDPSLGKVKTFQLSEFLIQWTIYLGPVLAYFVFIGWIVPWFYWYLRIRPRQYRLMGRYNDISPEFKGAWAFNICAWMDNKILCCLLFCCLPARMADTWDALGVIPYWSGVKRSFCCCLLYMFGCPCCGACLASHQRSEIRDFFGFGDGVKGNIELGDYCCYLCCSICCVVQETRHVDGAISVLPPPFWNDVPAELTVNDDDGGAVDVDTVVVYVHEHGHAQGEGEGVH